MDKTSGFKAVDLKVLSQYELLKLVKNGDSDALKELMERLKSNGSSLFGSNRNEKSGEEYH
ncbi:MAG: hypothetical protein PWQ20_883 [Thermotogaceae bacterium]|jgi:hypothetical protein|nr:hypothetical protein [Thermotogaceae bacterium]MDN5337813.1 hypothetical protein [Thermotogaceae bacterium]